jgi:hypothetical protein
MSVDDEHQAAEAREKKPVKTGSGNQAMML